MKRKIIFSFLFFALISAFAFGRSSFKAPLPQGFVNDFAGVLSEKAKLTIEEAAGWLKQKTGAEIAVAVLKDIYPYDIETYAVKLFEKWGIGQKGKDNGVLILVALKQRKVRIEVGYGLEGAVPDALAKEIIESQIIPFFRQGDFSQGLLLGFLQVAKLVAKEYNLAFSYDKALASLEKEKPLARHKPSALRLIFTLLFLFFFFGRGFFFPFLFFPLGGFWSEGSGGFGSGFDSFGGFGGGLSGGGGASGGW